MRVATRSSLGGPDEAAFARRRCDSSMSRLWLKCRNSTADTELPKRSSSVDDRLDAGSWFHINDSPPMQVGLSVCSSWRAQMTVVRFEDRCYLNGEMANVSCEISVRSLTGRDVKKLDAHLRRRDLEALGRSIRNAADDAQP